jgi:hypothetical protein
MDLSHQFWQPLVAVLADANKCYNEINHIVMSLLLLAIGDVDGPVSAILTPIQQMRFYKPTGWGDLDTFIGGRPNLNPLQGLCQGNGVALACWIMLSFLMMSVYQCRELISTTVLPLNGDMINFTGEIFVDDTDLLALVPDKYNIQA